MAEVKPKLHRFLQGYKGYLVKQGKVFKQWSSRYFVLEKRRLKYYEDNTMTCLLGEILIDKNVHLYDINEEVDNMRNLFYFTGRNPSGEEESLFLSASSEKEKHDWLEAITDAVHDGFKQIFQPDLWASDFYPYIDVGIFYRKSGVAAENGNIIRPSNTDFEPDVVFKGLNLEDKFSFIMLDIDPISSIENPNNKFYLHWGVINISGLDIKSGEQLAPYVPPAPVYNSGLHRFFFLLFKQRAYISSIVLNEIIELFHKRDGFPFMKWVRLMDFSDPAGINGFYAGWEDYCDELHNRLSYTPPETFRSPNQEAILKKEQSRKRIEQSMAELYRDLALRDILVGHEEAIPNPKQVPISLQVHIGSSSDIVKDGQIVAVSSTLTQPRITFEDYSPHEEHHYTLILTDPDFPARVNANLRELVHWVVVNIPSNRVAEGNTVLSYLPPSPPFSSGLHRYVFCLFKQSRILSAEEIESGKAFFEKRVGIKSYDWVKQTSSGYELSPIGLEAFIAEYDDCVDDLHERLQWIPPRPYRSAKQSEKFASIENNDADAEREAKVSELEYELKTSVLQALAQLHSAPLPTVSPKPEPVKLSKPSAKEEASSPMITSEAKSKVEPLAAKVDRVTVTTTSTSVTSRIIHHPKTTVSEPRDSLSPSPINIQTIKPLFNDVGILPDEWTERQKLLKAPLNRQNGLSAKSFIDTDKETENADDDIFSKIVGEEKEDIKPAGDLKLEPKPVATPSTPKTITISNTDDLDSLFAPVEGGKAEIENYDDDEEEEPPNPSKPVASETTNVGASKSSGEGPDHRSVPNSLFKKIGLFKSQSQYIPTDDSSNASKPKRLAMSTSMYFKPPSTDENLKSKRLSSSTSMYYKPFENSKQDIAIKAENSAEAMAFCSTYDVSSPTIFEGEIMKKKFSTDFMFKDSIIWIDPTSKSIHWAKSVAERKNPQFSKYIFLNRIHALDQEGTVKPQGEMKGIFKHADYHGTTIIVHLESEEFLELKLSLEGTPPTPKRITDWVKVMKALSG